ncbi:MAG: hypothetical protein IPM97_00190 [Bdellovibrionaceae bacterium]|nr:hypothetical protein [Pseudobdellovibrionaceae bacterium]
MSNSPFVNLALLETIRAKNSGYYVDNFVTFLAVGIKDFEKDEYVLSDFQELFTKTINTTVPLSAIQLILNRTCKKGLLTRNDHRYTRVLSKVDKIADAFIKRKNEIIEAQNSFFDTFIKYTNDKYSITLTRDEAESYFSGFLKRYQLDLLDGSTGSTQNVVGGSVKNPDYLISSFIADIYKTNKDVFNHLEKTLRGYLVTNYLVIRGNEPDSANLNGLVAVLDTPLLMGLVGFNGKLRSDSCLEMLTLGQSLKVSFVVFEHIFDEWESIFHAWVSDLRSKNFKGFNSSTLALLQAKGYDAASIEAYIPRLKSKLEQMLIRVVDRPQYNEAHTIDELGLQEHLKRQGMSDVNSRLERDVKTVAGIYSMRKGSSRMSLHQKPALFVTSNNTLVKEVNGFFSKEISDKSIPIVCNDIWFTNLCWMMNPNSAPDLPQHLLVANCYSAIHSDDKFWDNFLNRLRRLKKEGKIDPEDYKLVRYELDLKSCLKEQTVTEGIDFGDETVFEVVKSTKEKILKKKDDEIKELRSSLVQRDLVINRISEIASTGISNLVFAIVTIGLVYLNYLFWQQQSSAVYFALTTLVAIASLLFDVSLWRRRLDIKRWLCGKIRLWLSSYFQQVDNDSLSI